MLRYLGSLMDGLGDRGTRETVQRQAGICGDRQGAGPGLRHHARIRRHRGTASAAGVGNPLPLPFEGSSKIPQILATKDGEYLFRVNGTDEGGCLAFFVKIEGHWEGRLNGPVVEAGKWYDVDVVWSGQKMRMDVNGETFELARSGRINPGEKPLQVGPIAGVIDRLEIRNPSLTRTNLLAKLAKSSAGQAASQESSSLQEPIQFGGEAGWNGWQPQNGATCEARGEQLAATFPAGSSMLVSPALACELGPRPFICLDLQLADPGWSGVLDFATDAGTGSISFTPQWEGRPTVIAGSTSEAWTGTLRRLSLSFSGGKGPVTIKQVALADRPIGKPSFYIRSLAPGRAKLRPNREETVVAGIENVGGEAESICARLSVPKGVTILDKAERTVSYLGQWTISTWPPGVFAPTSRDVHRARGG